MSEPSFELRLIARVESSLTKRALAPKQGSEGAPEAAIVFGVRNLEALDGTPVLDVKPVI